MDSRTRRAQGDDGAAVLEFAIVAVLLFTVVFAIIQFGLILSFKQDMTRAAAEGARGGAVAYPSTSPGGGAPGDLAKQAADLAVQDAVREFGGSFSSAGCSRAGMTCAPAVIIPCPDEPAVRCVKVELTYRYADHPLYGDMPFVSAFYPNEVKATSIARINED